MEKLKYIRLQENDGTYSANIPISADAQNIVMQNGSTLQDTIGDIDHTTDGDISTNIEGLHTSISELAAQKLNKSEIGTYIPEYVNNWLNTNITPTPAQQAVAIDESLTVHGMAADAKAVGDVYEKLDDEVNEVKATLFGGQIKNYKENKNIDPTTGQLIDEEGTCTSELIPLTWTNAARYDCGDNTKTTYQIAFYNSNNEFITSFKNPFSVGDTTYRSIDADVQITSSDTPAYVRFSFKNNTVGKVTFSSSNDDSYYWIAKTFILEDLINNIDSLNKDINGYISKNYIEEKMLRANTLGYHEILNHPNVSISNYIPVTQDFYEKIGFEYTDDSNDAQRYEMWMFDINKNFLTYFNRGSTGTNFIQNITIVENTAYIIISFKKGFNGKIFKHGDQSVVYYEAKDIEIEGSLQKIDNLNNSIGNLNNLETDIKQAINEFGLQKSPVSLITESNIFATGIKVVGYYYNGEPKVSSLYKYYKIYVESGETYHFTYISTTGQYTKPSKIYGNGSIIFEPDSPISGIYDYMADYTGYLYISFPIARDAYGYKGSSYIEGSYEKPLLGCLSNEVDNKYFVAPSQFGMYKAIEQTLQNVYTDKNLLLTSPLFEGKYPVVGSSSKPASMASNENYNTFKISVVVGHQYVISPKMRYIMYENDTSIINEGSAGTSEDYTFTASATGLVYVTFIGGVSVLSQAYIYDKADVVNALKEVGTYKRPIFASYKRSATTIPYYETESASMGANDVLEISEMHISKNVLYEFSARLTEFGNIVIGHGPEATAYSSRVVLNDTNAIVYYDSEDTTQESEPHGLTFSDFIFVKIKTTDHFSADITIITEGGSFTFTADNWKGNSSGKYYVNVLGGSFTNAKFTLMLMDAFCPIYMFGDSYLNLPTASTTNRWLYYLKQDGGLNNVLINAYGGETSIPAITALTTLGYTKRPKFAVWAMGMNDTADSSDTEAASSWRERVKMFIAWCNENYITPILMTIPSTPTKNNNGKCKFVRDSGYRYIDVAKAVGADISTNWYSGLLSNDEKHPSPLGALVIYNRVLLDFPEILQK